ncbi:MAG: hypothetical protein ACLR7F_09095, partial [Waltera sp.]
FKLAAVIHLVTGSLPTGTELAMALATMLLNSVAMIALKIMLDRHVGAELRKAMPGKAWLPGVLTGTVAVSLFFVSMVYPPTGIYLPGIKYKYLGVFTANPFHNATYMAARPFAILAFFKYAELMPLYEQDNATRSMEEIISSFLFICYWQRWRSRALRSYWGAAGILMLWRMFHSKFRTSCPPFGWEYASFLLLRICCTSSAVCSSRRRDRKAASVLRWDMCGCSIAAIFRWLLVWLSVSHPGASVEL